MRTGSRSLAVPGGGVDETALHLTGDETAAGVKTFEDGIQVGTDEIRAILATLGDTQGIWIDLTLGGGTNPVQHLKLRGKGAGAEIQTYSPLNATEGLYVDGVDRVPLFAYKAVDQAPITNSAVLEDITGLTVPVRANRRYLAEIAVVYDTGSTADAQVGLSVPAGATGTWWHASAKNNADSSPNFGATSIATALQAGGVSSGTVLAANYRGLIHVAGTAGAVQVRGAQAVSNPGNTIFKADSYIRLTEVP